MTDQRPLINLDDYLKERDILSQKRARELFTYDPDEGKLCWRVAQGRVCAGEWAGSAGPRYWEVKVDGRSYLAHRIIWLWMTGEWPEWPEEIDHIDRDGFNNKWANLRCVPHPDNLKNTGQYSNNTTGAKGVGKSYGKYKARITVDGRRIHLGYFDTLEEASMARKRAEEEYFGEFAPIEDGSVA